MPACGGVSQKTFSSTMLSRNPDDCREVIYQFESERRAGEFANIDNLPALLTKRLLELSASPS